RRRAVRPPAGAVRAPNPRVGVGPLLEGCVNNYAFGLRGRAVDQVAHLVRRLRELREHVAGDDVGIGRVRTADADADAAEVRRSQAFEQRLESVLAGQAAAD